MSWAQVQCISLFLSILEQGHFRREENGERAAVFASISLGTSLYTLSVYIQQRATGVAQAEQVAQGVRFLLPYRTVLAFNVFPD